MKNFYEKALSSEFYENSIPNSTEIHTTVGKPKQANRLTRDITITHLSQERDSYSGQEHFCIINNHHYALVSGT